MQIEIITESNVADALKLGHALCEESRYSAFSFNLDKLMVFADAAMALDDYAGWLAYVDGKPVGIMVGFYTEFIFGKDRIAQDIMLYVLSGHRGSRLAFKLVQAYEQWAIDQGCRVAQLGATTGIETERTVAFLERLGYSRVGIITQKELCHVRRRRKVSTPTSSGTPTTNHC